MNLEVPEAQNLSAARPPKPGPLAVIYLGSNAITLLIGEMSARGKVRALELLSQPVPLGEDVFRQGAVSREAVERTLEVLTSHAQVMREYGLTGPPVRLAATNVLLEASNQDLLLNRIQVALGWQTRLLDDGEMTRLIYLSARQLLEKHKNLADKSTLITHIGPGNTRALLFENGRIQDYHRYPLGLERTREQVDQMRGDLSLNARMIGQASRTAVGQIGYDFAKPPVRQIVALGHEIQALAQLGEGRGTRARVLPVKKLAALSAEIEEQGLERLARRLQIDYRTADLLLYAVALHLQLAVEFKLEQIILPTAEFEETLLIGLVSPSTNVSHFRNEVIQTALNLGRKFRIDTAHANQVARLSMTLFEVLKPLHRLGPRESLILNAAALLRETGHLINSRNHHLHSEYIIRHNEVFGLDLHDTELAALVARYHRGPAPSLEHLDYQLLDQDQRLIVSKLAALLRVADSLDRGKGTRLSIKGTRISGRHLLLEIEGIKDTSAVQLALNRKAGLFASLFGLDVVLEIAPASFSPAPPQP